MYALALLHRGGSVLAEEAVVDAIASAARAPSIEAAGPSKVWRLLASHVEAPGAGLVAVGSPQATVRMADLSTVQLETMALVVTGRQPADVADLLGLPPEQVCDDLVSGTRALEAAMRTVPVTG